MVPSRNLIKTAVLMLLASMLALGLAAPLVAEDLSDNATCLECHEGEERAPPSDPNVPQVHNPEGGFFVEDHDMWSCIDCHDAITEIPHPDEVIGTSEVDCLNCHEEVPSK